ncbi:hypothetical protein [Paenibacillus contaminans]|nr:hypothetical protein [Paenibacillus contaminans]
MKRNIGIKSGVRKAVKTASVTHFADANFGERSKGSGSTTEGGLCYA